jgi:hypothetical protein
MRQLARISLAATAALMLFTSTASAQVGSDVVGGGGQGVLDSVASPPSSVAVLASCTVTRRTGTTVWFGYSNTSTERRVALVGSGNTVTVNGVAGAPNRGQITQFQPGVVQRAFAVTVPVGSTATWTVTPANILGVSDATSSATSSSSTPACPIGAGVRSATPQVVGSLTPTITALPVNQRLSNGLLVRSSLKLSTNGVVSSCSDGGVPLPPKVLWGYAVSPPGQAGGLVVPSGAPFEALQATKVVRVDSDGTFTFERSYEATRSVVDPQRISVFGSLQEQVAGTAQVAWGYSSISVIADVEARCQFGSGIVKSSTTVWVDPTFGSGFNFHMVTDRLAQSTRSAEYCLPPYPTSGCDVRAIGVGPGGRSYR